MSETNYNEMEIERQALGCEVRSLYDLGKMYMDKADKADKADDAVIADALRGKAETVRKEAKLRNEKLKVIEARRDQMLRDAAKSLAR